MKNIPKDNYCVIMAGGIGSRFWPWSRSDRPKQFLDIISSGRTLIQATFDRFDPFIPEENIFVMTGKQFESQMLKELSALHPSQILTEPERRNTAPAIAYAAYKIGSINPDAVMIATPADQHIGNVGLFKDTVTQAIDYALHNHCLMTIGIEPTYPATGYGYIEMSATVRAEGIGPIERFQEKPTEEQAKKLLASGNYLWNSGIFIWRVRDIITALETYLPEVAVHFAEIDAYGAPNETEAVARAFLASPSISIDYGVMEKAKNVCTIPGRFEWDDLGTWQSLYRYQEQHPEPVVHTSQCKGRLILDNSPNTMVHQGVMGKDVVVVGLEDYLVVDLDDILLIAPKNDEKKLHEWMDTYAKKLKK